MSYMIGVDVGGTFTDLSVFDTEKDTVFNYKLSSTPGDPSLAIVDGIREVMEIKGFGPEEISYLAHGTTVATNALIEKKGSRIGIITTEGLKDLMEIGWQKRPNLYDLLKPKAQRIIPPGLCTEVPERILSDGSIKVPLDEEAVIRVIAYLKKQKVDAIAVCTLFSYLNPVHELRIREICREYFPEAYVSLSHELVHEFREYSRMSTTALNAYLGPVMKKYVQHFEESVRNAGIRVNPYVTQSNGAIISVSETVECPIKTAVSGPSAGVIGAAYMGGLCGLKNIITFDMGGTSIDVSLIDNGKPQLSNERLVEGYPARIPMIDIVTLGAGGGSIARIDDGGALKVGPESAGAVPGPACYMRGGKDPCVTDANIVLGKLNRERILGGRMEVDIKLAEDAIRDKICAPSGLSLKEAAAGIVSVVNSNMMRAIRIVSVERGYDVREFALMAFGGAGPLHACEVAAELGIRRVMVPESAGTLCSLGLLMADTKFDLSRSRIMIAEPGSISRMNEVFAEMRAEGDGLLDKEHIGREKRSYQLSVDARYERQNYEINIPVRGTEVTEEILAEFLAAFHENHLRSFGYKKENFNVQLVNFRLSAIGEVEKPVLKARKLNKNAALPEPKELRKVLFVNMDDYVDTPVYNRTDFEPGVKGSGPVVIEQMDCTTVIPPGWSFENDAYNNLHLIHEEEVK